MVDEFLLQPFVYNTNGKNTLLSLLEEHWIERLELGKGTIYIVSGFGNYNGGVRFYDIFREHITRGGKVCAIFGGSTSQKLTSKELVKELLECGVKVTVLNRKRIMHAKCFGFKSETEQSLVITSGNFTGPGMSQNVEAALGLGTETLKKIGFDWNGMFESFMAQTWDTYNPNLPLTDSPEWKLLYAEDFRKTSKLDEDEANTMLITIGHADTVRINAEPGTAQGKGSQYFWLSKDAFNFFPPLTIPNSRGVKPTYSAIIEMRYIDLEKVDKETRVTFEAGNNVDFRLGTGPLRYTKLAQEEDVAAITRRANAIYELKIIKKDTDIYNKLHPFMINFIGHRGKKYGYIPNEKFDNIIGRPSSIAKQ